jgi:hypothetical protein
MVSRCDRVQEIAQRKPKRAERGLRTKEKDGESLHTERWGFAS